MAFVKTNIGNVKQSVVKDTPDKSGGSRAPSVFFTPVNGKTHVLRLLPGWTDEGPNAGLPYKRIFQHWDLPSGQRSICSNRITDGAERCFICEQLEQMKATGDPQDEKEARRMRPGRRFIYQIIDRDDPFWLPSDKETQEKPEILGKPKIKFLSLGWTVHRQITDYFAASQWGDIADPFEGVDFELVRTGKGLDTVYGITMQRNSTAIFRDDQGNTHEEFMSYVAENLYNLDEHPFFRTPSYEETMTAWHGKDSTPNVTEKASLPPSSASQSKGVNMEGWNELVMLGRVVPKEKITQYPQEQIPWCYAQEPNPTDNSCWGCGLVADCTKTFQHTSGLQYQNGPEIAKSLPAAPVSMGKKPLGKPSAVEATPQEAFANYMADPVEDMESFLEKAAKG